MKEDDLKVIINKILRSPIMKSEDDIENYCLLKGLSDNHKKTLCISKESIHKYYDSGILDEKDKKVIVTAWKIISQNSSQTEKKSDSQNQVVSKKVDTSSKQKDFISIEYYKNMSYSKRLLTIAQFFIEKKLSKSEAIKLFKDFSYREDDVKIAVRIVKKESIDSIIESMDIDNIDNLSNFQKLIALSYHLKIGKIDNIRLKYIINKDSIDIDEFDYLYNFIYGESYLDILQSDTDYKNILTEVAKEFSDKEGIYIGYKIPEKKLKNFINAVNIELKGTPIILIDLTIFGSAKNAFVITTDGIYYGYKEVFGDIVYDYIDWNRFYNAIIESQELGISINEQRYNISGSSVKAEDITELFKQIQKALRKIPGTSIVSKSEAEEYFPDIYKKPYDYMGLFIAQALIYTSPVYRITNRIIEINLELKDENLELEEIRALYEFLSSKSENEKSIKEGEKEYISFILNSTQSIREDIASIIGRENIGNIFLVDESAKQEILNTMRNIRTSIIHKLTEFNNHYLQLKQFWIQIDEGAGKELEKFIKGGMLGVAGATLFGPLGLAAAIGASYLTETKQEEKIEQSEAILLENLNRVYDELIEQIQIYRDAYIELSKKVSLQYINNYQQAHKIALKVGKEKEFLNYFSKELEVMATDPSFVEMRESIKFLDEIGKE